MRGRTVIWPTTVPHGGGQDSAWGTWGVASGFPPTGGSRCSRRGRWMKPEWHQLLSKGGWRQETAVCVTSALQLGAVNQKTWKAQTQANQDATPLGRQSPRQVWDQVVWCRVLSSLQKDLSESWPLSSLRDKLQLRILFFFYDKDCCYPKAGLFRPIGDSASGPGALMVPGFLIGSWARGIHRQELNHWGLRSLFLREYAPGFRAWLLERNRTGSVSSVFSSVKWVDNFLLRWHPVDIVREPHGVIFLYFTFKKEKKSMWHLNSILFSPICPKCCHWDMRLILRHC